MKRVKAVVAVIALGVILPTYSNAYTSYNGSEADIASAVSSADSFSSILGRATGKPKSLDEQIEEIQKLAKLDPKLQLRLKQLKEARQASDKQKNLKTEMSLIDLAVTKKRSDDIKALNNTIATAGSNAPTPNTSNIQNASCPVNPQQVTQIAQMFNSDIMRTFQDKLQNKLTKEEEENPLKLLSAFQNIAKAAKDKAENFTSVLDQKAEKPIGQTAIASKEQQIKDAEKKIRFWEKDASEKAVANIEDFYSQTGLFAKLLNTRKADKDILKATSEASGKSRFMRTMMRDQLKGMAQQAFTFCDNQKSELPSLINQIEEAAANKRKANDAVVRRLKRDTTEEAEAIQCEQAAQAMDDIELTLGDASQLAQAEAALGKQFDAKSVQKNINDLLAGWSNAVSFAMGNQSSQFGQFQQQQAAFGQVGQPQGQFGLKKALDVCGASAQLVEKAKKQKARLQGEVSDAFVNEGSSAPRRGRPGYAGHI